MFLFLSVSYGMYAYGMHAYGMYAYGMYTGTYFCTYFLFLNFISISDLLTDASFRIGLPSILSFGAMNFLKNAFEVY